MEYDDFHEENNRIFIGVSNSCISSSIIFDFVKDFDCHNYNIHSFLTKNEHIHAILSC